MQIVGECYLRASYEGAATFAAHFGLWQHMLNLTILDDRWRIDAQQGYLTSLHAPRPADEWKESPQTTPRRLLKAVCLVPSRLEHINDARGIYLCGVAEQLLAFPKSRAFSPTGVLGPSPAPDAVQFVNNQHWEEYPFSCGQRRPLRAIRIPRLTLASLVLGPSWCWMGVLHSCTTTGTTWLP